MFDSRQNEDKSLKHLPPMQSTPTRSRPPETRPREKPPPCSQHPPETAHKKHARERSTPPPPCSQRPPEAARQNTPEREAPLPSTPHFVDRNDQNCRRGKRLCASKPPPPGRRPSAHLSRSSNLDPRSSIHEHQFLVGDSYGPAKISKSSSISGISVSTTLLAPPAGGKRFCASQPIILPGSSG